MKTENRFQCGFIAGSLAVGGWMAVLLCLWPALTRAETAVQAWVQRYNGPGNTNDYATAVAVDGSNNVIVTGPSTGSGGDDDFATIKYICVPSPVLTNLSGSNGTFQMRVDGVLQPGTLVIEASTNLAGWAPVFTNTTPTNVLFYTDPDAGSQCWRFYRAFQFP
jgi:hypothetical protein